MKMIADAGFDWVRMDFKWDATESERGRYDFSAYDRLMAAMEQHKIRALFILDYGNPLYDNGAPPRTQSAREAFARWAVAAAKHFAGRDVLWEIYNEPNHEMFWPPRPNVDEYVSLALTVGRAFRAEAPQEKLIGPATSEIDLPFLEACFKAGLLDYWSAVSVHPYLRSDPERVASRYCRIRELMTKYTRVRTRSGSDGAAVHQGGADGPIPIISSEWGYSTSWPGMSKEKQGQLVARQWLTNVGNDIPLSIWYEWRDGGADANEPEHNFGVVSNSYPQDRNPVYNPKPAYLAAKTLTTIFGGYRFEKRIDVGDPDDYVLAFRQGNDLRFAAWTTGRAHSVHLPLNPGQYTTVGHTGENVAHLTADPKGLAITLSTAPVYIR
ncbi:MAG: cellulase family glycosylhydrolase [Pyrinomonadaceae bacterium]